ncbi:MAG: hypothetical protein AAF433_01550 [Bacteroidota bacterium]
MPDSYRKAWIGTILGMIFILIIIGFSVEFERLSYVLKAAGLVALGLKTGVAISFLSSLIFWDKKQWPPLTRVKAILLSLLIGMIVGAWLILLTNRLGGVLQDYETIQVVVKEEVGYVRGKALKADHSSNLVPDRYLSTFSYQGEEYQLSLAHPLFPNLVFGDQASLQLARGLWGYKYILPPE